MSCRACSPDLHLQTGELLRRLLESRLNKVTHKWTSQMSRVTKPYLPGLRAAVGDVLFCKITFLAAVVCAVGSQKCWTWTHCTAETMWLSGSDKLLISKLVNKAGMPPSAYMSTLGAYVGHTLTTKFTPCLIEDRFSKQHMFLKVSRSQKCKWWQIHLHI